MDLNCLVKSAGFGIRKPGFHLTVHQLLGYSETLFSPVQMENALLICNITVNFLKNERERERKKKQKKRERKKATMHGKT